MTFYIALRYPCNIILMLEIDIITMSRQYQFESAYIAMKIQQKTDIATILRAHQAANLIVFENHFL